MNTHKNARLTIHGRALLVRRIIEHGQRPAEAAQAMGVSTPTAYKWLRRYRAQGPAGFQERSSRPASCPHLDIKRLGRFQRPGHCVTGDRQAGRSRGSGWDYVHGAIDDHSRIAHATIRPNETAAGAVKALLSALCYYRGLGVRFKAVLTDNGACCWSRRFAKACRRLGPKYRRTRPYRPRTNG